MKKHIILSISAYALLTCAAAASSSKPFDEIMTSYESIRVRLLYDSVEGIGKRAEAIRRAAESAVQAESTGEELRPLLGKIAGFAQELARVEDIEVSRELFYEISKMLVQYRAKITGEDLPTVMYCPMSRKSWLQLDDEVGNPYHGQSMASCGNVVGGK